MDGQFEIGRHALMIHTPLTNDGDINCVNQQGERKFPKLDYSKGFPDWWYLSKTEISVPSEHVQHGKRYAAEVKLSHFYEIDHYKNKLGVISFFMQDFEGEPSWPYLDKLICRWRREEEEKRVSCGLPPAPVYKMCELYRGQTRTADDFEAPTQAVIVPTRAPLVAPPAIPIVNHGGDPEEFRLPLGLCEGDCDFMTDCAPGLICYQRDALDAVPGCLGGETDSTNTDYCVFDPYGPGYSVPTAQPTNAPSITARPTLTPLDPIPLVDYGGTPPLNVPLKLCEGDCDKDEDCDLGLVCFQRTSYEPVPGCIGGTTDMQKTDYCVFDIYGPGYVMTPGQNAVSAPPINQASGPTMSPTVFSRPLGEPIRVQNLGWEPPIPLGECAGDCDTDEDCGPGMYCYQRNSPYENVPGCLGGDEDPSLTDYCAFRSLPTTTPETVPATPTIAPTVSPTTTIPSTSAPVVGSFPSVTIVGWSPSDLLNECEGDCDEDTDCSPGLVCFQRNRANVNVPGCLGGDLDKSLTDYCIKNPNLEEQTEESGADLDVTSPTNAPILSSPQPSESSLESTSDLPPIKDLGWTPPSEVKPLGLCEGDCDIRQDCGPGLDCYQRYLPNLPVPGCSGGELDDTLTDYCVPIEMMNTNQVLTAPDRNRATAAPEEASIPEATPTSEAISQTTEAPQMQPTDAPILQATAAPVVQATTAPAQTLAPVENRFDQPTIVPGTITGVSTIPPIVSCDAFPEVNFFRMCKDDSCCTNPRSTSDFCQETYELLGDATESSCDHCCLSEQGKAQQVGPAPEANPQIPKLLQCTDVEQPNRICSEGSSCCDSSGERSSFCQESYARYSSEEIESICVSFCIHVRCTPVLYTDSIVSCITVVLLLSIKDTRSGRNQSPIGATS